MPILRFVICNRQTGLRQPVIISATGAGSFLTILSLRQKDCRFPDKVFVCKICCILIQMSLFFQWASLHKQAKRHYLKQWCQCSPTHICAIGLQWVNLSYMDSHHKYVGTPLSRLLYIKQYYVLMRQICFQFSLYIIQHLFQYCNITKYHLIHWGRDKMAAIFQTTYSNAISWMKWKCMNFD